MKQRWNSWVKPKSKKWSKHEISPPTQRISQQTNAYTLKIRQNGAQPPMENGFPPHLTEEI